MKSGNEYTLAVIMPCWNTEQYLSEMLDSVIGQTFDDWQLFCVDDHSTDGTTALLASYEKKDPRIHCLKRKSEKKGAPVCRNEGIEMISPSQYVIFIDSDDILAPYCFQQRVDYMKEHPELDFATFPAISFEDTSDMKSGILWGYDFLDDATKCLILGTLSMVGWTNIYKSQSVFEYDLQWDSNLLSLQDRDWNNQAIQKGLKYAFASKEPSVRIDYYYRIVGTSISRKIRTTPHYDSHVYYIDKTIRSLTDSQLAKYDFALRVFVWKLAYVIMSDKESFGRLKNNPWLCRHKWLKARLVFSSLLKNHPGRLLLYPLIAVYNKALYTKYWKYIMIERDRAFNEVS